MPELSSRQAVVYQLIPLGNHFCHEVLFSSFLSSCDKKKKTENKMRETCVFAAPNFRDFSRKLDVHLRKMKFITGVAISKAEK